jgi:hypothetical protein
MPKQVQEPAGQGRSPAGSTFEEVRREIARRNELAHEKARKVRAAQERKQLAVKRQQDLL